MKHVILPVFFLCAAATAAAQRQIIVERPSPPPDTTAVRLDSGARRLVLDPVQLAYQLREDSINQAAEEKIRQLITKLERKFGDPETEEEVGRMIGEAVMDQQMALLQLQIDRAIITGDTTLLKGIEKALETLMQNSEAVRSAIERQLYLLEKEMESK